MPWAVARRWSGSGQAVERAAALLDEWLGRAVPKLARLNPVQRPPEAVPTPYRRPLLEEAVCRDEDDVPINCGCRWTDGKTPVAGYERISHPERFAGLASSCWRWPQTLRPITRCGTCNETPQCAGDELEDLVLGVAAGGFAERIYDVGGQPWIQFRLTAPDGNSLRGGEGSADPNKDLDEARTMLEKVPGGWHPWPLRALS